MRYLSLAWKNLFRRPVRSALTIAGVALAVAVAVSLGGFNLGYRQAINHSIERLGYQVMIMAKGCPYEAATMMLKGGSGLLYLPENAYESVKADPDIQAITPIFVGIAQKEGSSIRDDDAQKSFSILSGIDIPSFTVMKPWMRFKAGTGYEGGRWFGPKTADEVVMGFEVAQFEQRKVGDTFLASIVPNGQVQPVQHSFKVVGVLERTGTQDDGTIFLPLSTAQGIFGRPGALTIVGIKLKTFGAVALREFEGRWLKLPEVQVVSLEQVKGTLVSLVGTAQAMVAAVAVIAVFVAVIGVVNTILMSVYERTGEIGIMKALGAYRGDIFKLIWLETLLVCLTGAVAGSALATVAARGVEAAIKLVIDLGVQGSIVAIGPSMIGWALVGSIALGFFAGLYPAWRAASMRPIEAIREGE
jgi:putative ABC transport system permease protein